MTARKPNDPPKKPGPEAETLAIKGDWEKAVEKALRKPPTNTPSQPNRGSGT